MRNVIEGAAILFPKSKPSIERTLYFMKAAQHHMHCKDSARK